jgi:hypothetical protein
MRNAPFQLHRSGNEQGLVLLTTMVFLLLFAIVATTVFRGSLTSIQAVGNMQWRTEAVNASNEVVANILSDYAGFIQPALTYGLMATGTTGTAFYSDVNGDGKADILVTVDAIECSYVSAVKQEDLNPDKPEDLACMNSANMHSSTFCSEVQFAVLLNATDPVSAANVQMEQGIGVRVTGVELCKF